MATDPKGPPTEAEIEAAIYAVSEARFLCGDWRDDDESDYGVLKQAATDAENRLRELFLRAAASPPSALVEADDRDAKIAELRLLITAVATQIRVAHDKHGEDAPMAAQAHYEEALGMLADHAGEWSPECGKLRDFTTLGLYARENAELRQRAEKAEAALAEREARERDALAAFVADVHSLTAEFGDWQECDAGMIEGQEEEVTIDHNHTLQRLQELRRRAIRQHRREQLAAAADPSAVEPPR